MCVVCVMRAKLPTITKNGMRAIAVVVMAVVVILLATCRHERMTALVEDPRIASLDSLLSNIDDVDSLEVMLRHFRQAHDDLGEMLAFKQQGRLLRQQARFEQAIDVNKRWLNLATQFADTIAMCEALNNLGICSGRQGNVSAANGYYYQSLKLLDTFSRRDDDDATLVKALTLNGIGNIETILCHYSMADSVLREAMNSDFRVSRNVGIAINACDLVMVKQAMGQTDSAWYYVNKAMEHSRHGLYKRGEALCHMRMGELHEQEQRFSHALEEYKLAYDRFKALDDSWHLQQTCLDLARVSLLLDEREQSHHYLSEVEAEALRTGCKAHEAEANKIHYELSLLKGNVNEALQHYIRSTELFDSIYGLEKGEEMRAQRIEYRNWVKNNEKEMLNRDISHLKLMRNMQLLLTLLLLVMALAVIAALAYVIRERMRTQSIMRQIEETRSLFFTNVVHLLRTPLTAIMGAVDDITAEATLPDADGRHKENAKLIERQGKNLLTLMDRILEVGSVRSAVTQLKWSTGDGVTYLRMLLDSYLEQCAERHIELTYHPHETNVIIDTVPRYLNTIVHSLIDNAINYSRNYSQISVISQVEDNFFVIRVADNGMGIAPNDLPHVFDPFYRGAAAEQLIDGVGIGLTVVHDMVMALEGSVDIESTEGRGTVVTVKLPCRISRKGIKGKLGKLMPPSPTMTDKPQSREKLAEVDSTPKHEGLPVILVVEDNADVARLVGTVLSKEYTVYYAQDGERGLAMACEYVPDLVITDVKMPLMDGYEFTERLRATQGLCHIPVIILSARTSEDARVRGIKAGANAYLVKPFVKEELLAWVKNLLQLRDLAKQSDSQKNRIIEKPVLVNQDEDDRFLERFALAVDKQMSSGDKLDLDKFALMFKMGESQLKRKIHDMTGKTLTAYITQLRMEKALRLLCQDPDILIGDVAVECGFADVAYFSRVFRQYYGKTPTQARNDHQNQ